MGSIDPAGTGVPEETGALLAEYGLPAYEGPSWPTGLGRIISKPAFLTLPNYRSRSGLVDNRFVSFAGDRGGFCFRREGQWPVFNVNLERKRRSFVAPDLRTLMETVLTWESHLSGIYMLDAQLDTDKPEDLTRMKTILQALADDLVAVGAIPEGTGPVHRRGGYWAETLDWLRIDCLGAGYE